MILLPLVASAHDIEVQNADGVTIYYLRLVTKDDRTIKSIFCLTKDSLMGLKVNRFSLCVLSGHTLITQVAPTPPLYHKNRPLVFYQTL